MTQLLFEPPCSAPNPKLLLVWPRLTNALELGRPLVMNRWPEHPLRNGVVLAVRAVPAFWVALALTRQWFRG